MKKKFLTGPEIDQLSGAASAETVSMLVTSFRIAARAASAAWGFIRAKQWREVAYSWEEISDRDRDLQRAQEELEAALHDYSPENWPAPKPTAHDVLVGVYDECAAAPTREDILEILYRAIERTQD